jgi:hypothetical protein
MESFQILFKKINSNKWTLLTKNDKITNVLTKSANWSFLLNEEASLCPYQAYDMTIQYLASFVSGNLAEFAPILFSKINLKTSDSESAYWKIRRWLKCTSHKQYFKWFKHQQTNHYCMLKFKLIQHCNVLVRLNVEWPQSYHQIMIH